MQKILHIGNGESVHFIQNRFLMDIKFQVSYMCFIHFIYTHTFVHIYILASLLYYSLREVLQIDKFSLSSGILEK